MGSTILRRPRVPLRSICTSLAMRSACRSFGCGWSTHSDLIHNIQSIQFFSIQKLSFVAGLPKTNFSVKITPPSLSHCHRKNHFIIRTKFRMAGCHPFFKLADAGRSPEAAAQEWPRHRKAPRRSAWHIHGGETPKHWEIMAIDFFGDQL